MEAAISAIVGDLTSRVISFLTKKYTDNTGAGEKLERLQQLLLRIHSVVEDADGRYITNPKMLMQLKLIVESMYRGYHMLDIFRYKSIAEYTSHEEVRSLSSIPSKRSRIIAGATRNIAMANDLQCVVENLENVIDNMKEFVVLLGGYERMCRRPYDTYLYTDNFMFGRHVEKQQIMTILLQTPSHVGAPLVLPIIGGCRVGKKTLVSHVCNDERIRSYFSSILYINGDSISRMDQHTKLSNERALVVVEFARDVDDDDWEKFYSTVTRIAARGSKVVITSRFEKLSRFGTVKVVRLNNLSQEEFNYLFKMLAFGSTDKRDYPQLVSIANELAVALGGSLVTINVISNLLRRNLDVQFWLLILRRFKSMVESNLSHYGEHPKHTLEKERPIDITSLASTYPVRLRLKSPRVERGDSSKRNLPNFSFGDLIIGSVAIPNDEFMLMTWESRIPPYTKYVCDAVCVNEKHGCTTPTKKRRFSI